MAIPLQDVKYPNQGDLSPNSLEEIDDEVKRYQQEQRRERVQDYLQKFIKELQDLCKQEGPIIQLSVVRAIYNSQEKELKDAIFYALGKETGFDRLAALSFFMNSGRALAGGSNSPGISTDPYIDVEKFIERLMDKKDHFTLQMDQLKKLTERYTMSKSIEGCILVDSEEMSQRQENSNDKYRARQSNTVMMLRHNSNEQRASRPHFPPTKGSVDLKGVQFPGSVKNFKGHKYNTDDLSMVLYQDIKPSPPSTINQLPHQVQTPLPPQQIQIPKSLRNASKVLEPQLKPKRNFATGNMPPILAGDEQHQKMRSVLKQLRDSIKASNKFPKYVPQSISSSSPKNVQAPLVPPFHISNTHLF